MPVTHDATVVQPMTLTDSEVHFYQEHGFLCLPGFVAAGAVDALRGEVFDVLDANGVPRDSLDRATRTEDKLRQCAQYLAGSHLDNLINGPATMDVASRLIEGRAIRYLPFTAVKAAVAAAGSTCTRTTTTPGTTPRSAR